MNRTTTRLALQLHRFEIVSLGALTAVGVGLALLVCSWLDASGFGPACLAVTWNGGDLSPACASASEVFSAAESSAAARLAPTLVSFVPLLLAVVSGVALMGRELERGTARIAWSLAPSRMRWLAGRLLPVLAVVIVLGLAGGLASDRLLASTSPGTNPWASLQNFEMRGVGLAARVVFAFGVAVLCGALLGRVLPALLVATVVTFVGLAGGSSVHWKMLAAEAAPVAVQVRNPADLNFESGYLTPDGRLIGWEEMARIDGRHPGDPGDWTPSYPQAMRLVPGTRYPFVAARDVAALLGGTLVALGATFVVVRRTRPG